VIDAPTREEIPATAEAMAAGLHADPGWMHVVPDDEARLLAQRAIIGEAVRVAHRDGTLLVAREGGKVVGGLTWAAPGGYPPKWTRMVPVVPRMARLATRIGPRTLKELSRFGAAIEHIRPDEPVWYVQALSVAPRAQGRGFGGALLRVVLAKADATSTPCYLETGKPANVAYYERFGFTLLDDRALWDGGPSIWRMQRAAA
jgi:GNAT superfamily N-acetyltransferase